MVLSKVTAMSETSVSSPAIFRLGGYTTIMSQVFSPDGQLLAAASECGTVALFKVKDLASLSRSSPKEPASDKSYWSFHVGKADGQTNPRSKWSIQSMTSTADLLLVGAGCDGSRSFLFGFRWSELANKKLGGGGGDCWKIDSNQLPVDVNAVATDAHGSTHGKIFVGGGGNQSGGNGAALRVFDIETRSESRPALEGHTDFVHAVDFCPSANALVSASEDGSARVWDLRTQKGQVQIIEPAKHQSLQRPKIGKWLGAASLSGDWLGLGGGPKAALWHLRTLTPLDPYLPESVTPNVGGPGNAYQGGVHALHIYGPEQKVVTGGDLGGTVYMTNMTTGQILAEIPTSARGGTTYSVATMTEPFKVMALAGSSAKIDLCTGGAFEYKDASVRFPTPPVLA